MREKGKEKVNERKKRVLCAQQEKNGIWSRMKAGRVIQEKRDVHTTGKSLIIPGGQSHFERCNE